jgi:predicted alpha/beta superfamily hydrolase
MADLSTSPGQVVLPGSILQRLDSHNVPCQSNEVRVWLPPSYHDSCEARYPILYMPDGDYCFGMAVDVVRYLIRGELVPEMIIAAVGYGSDRPPEQGGLNMRSQDLSPFATGFTPEPRGEAFRLFLEQELVPSIESTYRVDPGRRAFYGFSLGGLFALYVMLKSPDLFQRHILVSPSLLPSTAQIVDQAEALVSAEAKYPLGLYMYIGELEPSVPLFTRLVALFKTWNIARFRFEWEIFPRGVHNTAPAEALAKGVRMAFGSKSICEAMYTAYMEGGIASAKALYNDLKARGDPDYNFAEDELNTLGYILLSREKISEAIEVLEVNVLAYPDSWNPYDSLGEAYLAAGDTVQARRNYEKSVQLNPKNEAGIAQLRRIEAAVNPQAEGRV